MRTAIPDDNQPATGDFLADCFGRLSEASDFRLSRGMLASEKLRGPVAWTTAAQRDAMTLFELHHAVVAYRAWPVEVAVRLGRRDYPYHPSLGITLAGGRCVAVDIVREEDEGTCQRSAFDRALREALASAGFGLVTMWGSRLRHDGCLRNARAVLRAMGPTVDGAAEFGCVRHVAAAGRPVTLAELKRAGAEVARTACVLAMRRTLAIDLRAPSVDACSVTLPVKGVAA